MSYLAVMKVVNDRVAKYGEFATRMGKQIKLDVSVYHRDNSRRIHLGFGDFRATVSESRIASTIIPSYLGA
jgi:hypothetical protein